MPKMTLDEFDTYLSENAVLDPESVAEKWQEIKRSLRKLECLENGGIDNWEWYGESLKEYFEEVEKEDPENET